ncbi:hypothetical protein CGZ80_10385 [Rhodopirellula sp. MGV]|nr:hypothetical protein CGZ80_10385 [Rhodopirellula sp. MGV]PNY36389.1 hypothetical protein C2E31_13225 [Rhodopirellula baltica]
MLGAFAWLVLRPFFAAQTHLITIRADNLGLSDVPIVPYAQQDFDALATNENWSTSDWTPMWKSTNAVEDLGERLEKAQFRPTDTLVMCLAVHGVSGEDGPALLLSDFEVRKPSIGRWAIDDVLQQIQRSKAGTKIVVIFDGAIASDPRLGIIENRFIEQLRNAVQSLNDPNLWVYCSHGPQEGSHVEDGPQRSVFGMFLAGATHAVADVNGDQQLSLSEWTTFTTANVKKWVEFASGQQQTQSPQLFWGGGELNKARNPVICGISASSQSQPWSTADVRAVPIKSVATQKQTETNTAAGQVIAEQKTLDERAKQLLLASAWDAMTSISSPDHRLIERPHLLKQLERELLLAETQLMRGSIDQQSSAVKFFNEFLAKAKSAEPNPIDQTKLAETVINPPLSLAVRSDLERISPRSVELALQIDNLLGKSSTANLQALYEALEQTDRKAVDKWVKANWKTEYEQRKEFQLLQQLLADTDLSWSMVQAAALACFDGERAAALDLKFGSWCRQSIEQADAERLFATELLRTRNNEHWDSRAEKLFASARQRYAEAMDRYQLAWHAQQAFYKSIRRLGFYLHQFSQLSSPPTRSESYLALKDLIDANHKLGATIGNLGNVDSKQVQSEMNLVATQLDRVQQLFGQSMADRILESPETAEAAGDAATLLRSPYLSSGTRSQLYALIQKVSRSELRKYELANLEIRQAITPKDEATFEPDVLLQAATLYVDYVAIVKSVVTSDVSSDLLRLVETMQCDLRLLAESGLQESRRNEIVSALERNSVEFSLEIVDSLSGQSTRSSEANLKLLLMQLLDPRDGWRFPRLDQSSVAMPERIKSSMLWQRRRDWQRETFSMLADQRDAASPAELLVKEIVALPDVSVPESVDLQYEGRKQIELVLSNPGDQPLETVLAIGFARQLIDLELEETHCDQTTTGKYAIEWENRLTEFGTQSSACFTIPARGQRIVAVGVNRVGRAIGTTEIVFDLFAAGAATKSQLDPTLLLNRQAACVELPVAELAVQQGGAQIESAFGGLQLTPFPNRQQDAHFGLTGQSAEARKVDLTCYASLGSLESSDWIDRVRDLMGKPLFTATYEVASSGETVFAGAGATTQETPKEAAAADAKSEHAPTQELLQHGMIAAIRDVQSGRTTYRPIRIALQRPRRYIDASVRYDGSRRQIVIDIAALESRLLPEGGPVEVSCDLEGVEGQVRGKLSGILSKSRLRDRLFIDLPNPPKDPVRLNVNVDGYPRAFVFDVLCEPNGLITEQTTLVELRLHANAPSGIVPASKTMSVTAVVNAPHGTFESNTDDIVIGFDLNHDGKPDEETAQMLTTDRQVKIGLLKASNDGRILLDVKASDFQIELPSARLENLSLDIAAAMTIDSRSHSFKPLSLYVDASPPVLGPIEASTGATGFVAGKVGTVTIWGIDQGAGIQRIEAGFDQDGSGAFPKGDAVFTAVRQSLRKWSVDLKLPADRGPQTLLVRAQDAVGNVSEPIPFQLTVQSPSAPEAAAKASLGDLFGLVRYRELPLANAEVTLMPAAQAAVAGAQDSAKGSAPIVVRTSPKGDYQLKGLKPGEHTVMFRGVVRNQVHLIEKKVSIKEGGARKRLDVDLP